MSGGSFNYLCHSDEPWHRSEDLESMAEALDQRGYADAAKETRQWLHYTPAAPREVLKDLWWAVEWKTSGDSNEEVVIDAYTQYQASDAIPSLDTTVPVSRQALLAAIHKARTLYAEAVTAGDHVLPGHECWAEFERLAEYLI